MRRASQAGRCWIGTSGWSYTDWKNAFYPDELPERDYLSYYVRHFSTVELNNSFYRLPTREAIEHWAETVPADFIFAVKGSRFISHINRLKVDKTSIQKFFDVMEPFYSSGKMGPILFQLPGRWHLDIKRLKSFIQILPKNYRYAFEFRDAEWLTADVFQLLTENNMACCIYDFREFQSPPVVTADFTYLRFHGPYKEPYTGAYSRQCLSAWAKRINQWLNNGLDVYGYFDNTGHGEAIQNARELIQLVQPAHTSQSSRKTSVTR